MVKLPKKPLHRPGAREKRAAREIAALLDRADLTSWSEAHALDAFEVINKRLGAKPLAHWTVDLDHRDGSRLHFIDALLVSHENWIGCFTKNHGFFIYHNSDLVRYNCVPKKGKPCPSAKKL